ncbi:MAG: GH32 C-terminal domain-containing protein [Lachnospiraceae bacterium]|nr:GH32 C-terminal domain-containing protein [Lachnospiraceae bacterium]
MISQLLEQARIYEKNAERRISENERPAFHLSARTGWLNDPNGFSYFGGMYHLYYQYYPYASHWDSMHWGHAASRDLLHWEYLPAALAPDMFYDEDGVYSGSSIDIPDGRRILMYTGVKKVQGPDHKLKEKQTQCIAVGDGVDFEKYVDNPVLTENHLPAGASGFEFRDPKLVRLPDGRFGCYVASLDKVGGGQILFYSSEDAFHWKYEGVIARNEGRFGRMWECPDFFELNGKWVLLTSPQDMLPGGFEYNSGNGTLCLIGSLEEGMKFKEERNQAIDYGIDFYAPQTVLAPDGRRIMIGWMQNWDACAIREPESAWAGQISLPRELSLKEGRLYQKPLSEFNSLRENRVQHRDVRFSGHLSLDGVSGRIVDIELYIRPGDDNDLFEKFQIRFAQDEKYYTLLQFRPREGILKIDREFSGSRRAIVHQRKCFVGENTRELKIRIILDRYSVEVFANEGRQVMTSTIYTAPHADGISFFADGSVLMDVVKYDIRREV